MQFLMYKRAHCDLSTDFIKSFEGLICAIYSAKKYDLNALTHKELDYPDFSGWERFCAGVNGDVPMVCICLYLKKRLGITFSLCTYIVQDIAAKLGLPEKATAEQIAEIVEKL